MRMAGYYMLDENNEPIPAPSVEEYFYWWQKADRVVKVDFVGDVKISTIFLGLDHGYGENHIPVLYETLVFGGELDGEMERYHTHTEALIGHECMLWKVMKAEVKDGL